MATLKAKDNPFKFASENWATQCSDLYAIKHEGIKAFALLSCSSTYNIGYEHQLSTCKAHPLPCTGSTDSGTMFSLALLSLPSTRSSPVQILEFTQYLELDSHNLKISILNLAHLYIHSCTYNKHLELFYHLHLQLYCL